MTAFGDAATQLAFSVHENRGVFSLLLGSGLSRAAEIPTGWEITTDLVRRVATAQGVDEQDDWAKWYVETEGKEPNYSELLGQVASTPAERRAILHSYIEPNEEDREQGRMNRPGFTGGQNSRRIAHHGTESKEDLKAVFT